MRGLIEVAPEGCSPAAKLKVVDMRPTSTGTKPRLLSILEVLKLFAKTHLGFHGKLNDSLQPPEDEDGLSRLLRLSKLKSFQ